MPLEKPQLKEFEDLLVTPPFREVLPMMQSTYDKGIEKGIEKGRETERRRLIRRQIEARFGPLREEVRQRFEALSADQLDELALTLLQAKSLQELGLDTF
jgi:hypothetical protein